MTIVRNGIEMHPTNAARLALLNNTCGVAARIMGRPLDILEIGSLTGTSAKVLAQHGTVTCIDPWDFPDGMETFRKNTEGLPISTLRGLSVDLLPHFSREIFDIIYIDGDHTYPIVAKDMHQAKRLIREYGIICGDDLEKQLVTPSDIKEATFYCEQDYYNGYHPGVSLAVLRTFGTVNECNGFWWV